MTPNNEEDVITFGGYPVTFKKVDDEVYITCKTITGTQTEIEYFLKHKGKVRCYFGGAKVRLWSDKTVRIDCLQDTFEKINIILTESKKIKDGKE